MAMGGGQTDAAIAALRECAAQGAWLCLKNLHLVVAWLPQLEKEVTMLDPHPHFRLWLTSAPPPAPLLTIKSRLPTTLPSQQRQ